VTSAGVFTGAHHRSTASKRAVHSSSGRFANWSSRMRISSRAFSRRAVGVA
jgi:hypothetical protein